MFTVAQSAKKTIKALILAFTVALVGCASIGNKTADTEEAYYNAAQKYLQKRNYSMAIERFTELQSRFPFGRYSKNSSLELIYAYYQSHNYATALIEADRFSRLNSDHPNVDYAWFIRSMSYYELYLTNRGIFGKGEAAMRSAEQGQKAFTSLRSYTDRFPTSLYRQEAIKAMVILKDSLARHELIVADYYIRRKAWIAAAERAQVVINHYPGVSAESDALVILVEAYTALNLATDRQISFERLQKDYPDHAVFSSGEYKAPRWEEDRWWLKVITLGAAS